MQYLNDVRIGRGIPKKQMMVLISCDSDKREHTGLEAYLSQEVSPT